MTVKPLGDPMEKKRLDWYECNDCGAVWPQDESIDCCHNCGSFDFFVTS